MRAYDPRHIGTPWWVTFDLDLASTGTNIITPSPVFTMPDTIHQNFRNWHLVILGFAYSYRADAAADGFELMWLDQQTSPTILRRIYRSVAQVAGTVEGSVTPCWIPGPAGIRVSVPDGDPRDPAPLRVRIVGTPTAAGGSILVWGVQTNAPEGLASRFTGSPHTIPG